MLTKAVGPVVKSGPASKQHIRSFKCWGLRPSGPPAEPAGKDKMAFLTLTSSTSSTDKDPSEAGRGIDDASNEAAGCLASSLVKFSEEGAAIESTDINRRT